MDQAGKEVFLLLFLLLCLHIDVILKYITNVPSYKKNYCDPQRTSRPWAASHELTIEEVRISPNSHMYFDKCKMKQYFRILYLRYILPLSHITPTITYWFLYWNSCTITQVFFWWLRFWSFWWLLPSWRVGGIEKPPHKRVNFQSLFIVEYKTINNILTTFINLHYCNFS